MEYVVLATAGSKVTFKIVNNTQTLVTLNQQRNQFHMACRKDLYSAQYYS